MLKALARIGRTPAARWSAFAYAVAAVILWPVPLLNVLHVESCAVLAAVAFFVSGLASLRLLGDGHPAVVVTRWQLGILILPLVLMSIPVVWAPNCSYLTGLLFFALFPVASVLLASSLAFLLHSLRVKRARTAFVAVAVATAVVTPVYDVGLFPQLYTYNHVFGGVLGPIYDEVLAIRPGLFAFRGLSLLWATLFWLSGTIALGERGMRRPLTVVAAAVSLVLVAAYSQSARLGWNTTHEVIEDALGRSLSTEHFEIYYDPRSFVDGEIETLADEIEYRYVVLSSALETALKKPVRIYVYPTEAVKGNLTGSRSTSVAPVWLRDPQVHILRSLVDRSIDHELVHVFSREFGMPLVRASPSVGLVEGLAAALEAPDGRPSTADLMAAAIQEGSRDSVVVVRDLTSALGAFGFWTGRGAVSYSATGSFVRHLLDSYGVETFKIVYRTGSFRNTYGKTADELAAAWYSAVRRGERVSAAALPMAEAQFSVPSLFEAECPHALPPFVEEYRNGLDYLSVHDTLSAVQSFEASVSLDPEYLPVVVRLASIRLREGEFGSVLSSLASDSVAMEYPQAIMITAEALAMAGRAEQALASFDAVEKIAPPYAVEFRLALSLVRRVAADTLAARWYFSGSSNMPAPESVRLDPLFAVHVASRALARNETAEACLALEDLPDDAPTYFDSDDRSLFVAQIHLWRATACALIQPDSAVDAGSRAVSLFAAAGEPDLSRLARDRASLARWKLSQTHGRTSPRSVSPSFEARDP